MGSRCSWPAACIKLTVVTTSARRRRIKSSDPARREVAAIDEYVDHLLVERTTIARSQSFELRGHSSECGDQLHEIGLPALHHLISQAKRHTASASRRHSDSPASIAFRAGKPRPWLRHKNSGARHPARLAKRPQRAPLAARYAMQRGFGAAGAFRALARRRACRARETGAKTHGDEGFVRLAWAFVQERAQFIALAPET